MLSKIVIASGLGLLALGGIAMAQDVANNSSQANNTSMDNGYSTSNSSSYNGTSGSSYSNTNTRAGERG
ncbi:MULTISPECIES: hypothetical protein [unclassified Sphingomonas]|uniref:hypothetical protein n=1 Tax=unclassified Sphingomonas TaxID=196159 RepID=UPI000A4E5513|nr:MULTISPECIES: hypothetical protein [unclassified Sphingomonas]